MIEFCFIFEPYLSFSWIPKFRSWSEQSTSSRVRKFALQLSTVLESCDSITVNYTEG